MLNVSTSSITAALGLIPSVFAALELKDLIDIAVVAFFIYIILLFLKQSRSHALVAALVALVALRYAAESWNLGLTRQLIQPFFTFTIVIFVIVFQREIRRFFEWFSARGRRLAEERRRSLAQDAAEDLASAIMQMAEQRIGGIFVFAGDYPLEEVVQGGYSLEGRISAPLILSIFDHTSPGHDGAVIVKNNRISRFGVHLPLAEHYEHYREHGTRHRAGVGITERTDALAIVVSEERGSISVSEGGELRLVADRAELERSIAVFMHESAQQGEVSPARILRRNNALKVGAVLLSVALWFTFVYQIGSTTQHFEVPIEFRGLPKEYVVSESERTEATITLSGSYRDFQNVDVKTLKVVVDLTQTEASLGWQRAALRKENISYPSYFTFVSIKPSSVGFNVSPAPKESATRAP